PSNIMVGAFSETVVIDWGLAKDLSVTGAPEVTAGPYRTSGDETAAGTVLGTPAYMPPEQARGEPVDERSDVYALGAILYHVLAGKPPYDGGSSTEILDAVQAHAPPPLEERQPEVPQDLLTIVRKAMAREASQRYRTA